ncbi:adenosylcobinamide-GDP ribazoletransferase [Bacillus xiapuensis]|uniref:adenosylcobinamide-GDP ribazoletransferase n=1 Tax=Bacillus xiapuensis TaxID=2014075 RepID=UPI000C2315DD|nr:adenosylcobinamide-GDP ribazoletransferase [Bacillus xiapuensis]
MKGKTYINGLLLSLQFFTTLPIRRELPMDAVHLRAALRMFPLFGLLKGAVYGGAFYLLLEWSPLTVLGNAFLLWLLPIIWTGGLHLDGWIDTSDAFFSYRDRKRRLEILKDPRVGAFGVLSLIVLLAARFIFLYETVALADSRIAFILMLIPFYSQTITGLLINGVPPAKQEGIAYYFQKGKDSSLMIRYLGWLLAAAAILVMTGWTIGLFLLFTAASGAFMLFMRRSIMKNFGGITGDLLGAGIEGVETYLWMIVWLLVSTGME